MNMWFGKIYFFGGVIFVFASRLNSMFPVNQNLTQLVVDTETRTVYVGGVNRLYQFTEDLKLQHEAVIGPEDDDKRCTPPIEIATCPNAKQTDNYVKLLLLDKPKERVVVCGTLFRGLCAFRSLTNISNELYYVKDKGEKCYVVTNDENLSTVGLITTVSDNRLMYVAKDNGQSDNGIVISIRVLDTTPGSDKVPFETISEALFYKQDRIRNHPRFLSVFETDEHVYFILSRLEQKPDGKNKTSIARLCKSDINFYSYIDIALECDGSTFNIAQSAYVTNPSEELARSMSDSGNYGNVTTHDKVLFVVFMKVDKGKPSKMSALCMFPLKQINDKMEEMRSKAYSNKPPPTIFNPYGETKTTGSSGGEDTALNFPCGDENLPFPLGSLEGVNMPPVKQYAKSITAVAVANENGHIVVFLGTSNGEVIKIFMQDTAKEYTTVQVWNNEPVTGDLIFGAKEERLYVMSTHKVTYIHVQTCGDFRNCQSCVTSGDPYCGWCVAKRKCSRKSVCERAEEEGHWLWSPNNSCVTTVTAEPELTTVSQGYVCKA